MHTCLFRGFVVGSRRLLTWGFVRGRAVRRRHCVGGAPAVSKYRGAVARRRWRGGGGAATVARRRWRKVFDLRILTWGFVRGRAVRRLHCVGGCAPVNFGRRRRNCNIYRRPRRGGGAARR